MSTYIIDLSEIIYRAFEEGDLEISHNIPNVAASSTYPILLDAIKFRAFQFFDQDEEEV